MFYKIFDKKSRGNRVDTESNYQWTSQITFTSIRKFKKRKVYLSFRDNIWDLDLAEMQSLSKYNKGTKYLLRAIDLFSKNLFSVVPLKDKRGISIVNAF